jgi:hypothetical protein
VKTQFISEITDKTEIIPFSPSHNLYHRHSLGRMEEIRSEVRFSSVNIDVTPAASPDPISTEEEPRPVQPPRTSGQEGQEGQARRIPE